MALGLRCSKSISSIPSDTLDILLNRCYARGALIILWEEDTFYLLKFWGYSYKHTRTNPYILRSPFWRAKPVFEDKQLCFSHLTFVLQEMLSLAWALFLLPFMWTHEISWTVGNGVSLFSSVIELYFIHGRLCSSAYKFWWNLCPCKIEGLVAAIVLSNEFIKQLMFFLVDVRDSFFLVDVLDNRINYIFVCL